jgi:tetratricopeptide (TPR) repeat protein
VPTVRRALIAVSQDDPAGQTLPVDGLRRRVATLITTHRHCDHDQVGCELPALIRDLHTTLATTGGDRRLLLAGAVLLHVQGTHAHLHHVGAPVDLCWQAVLLARHAACDHAGPTLRGLVALAAATALLTARELDIAQAELDAAPQACTNPASLPVAGMLTLTSALVAAADKRPDDADAALTHAAQLATQTAQASGYGLDFAPATVELWRLLVALETRDYPHAATLAGQLRPEQLTTHRSATYWAGYGQALARLRDRHDDAVRALYRAEQLCPTQVQRNPAVREVLAELLMHSRRDVIGRELRAMAYRAGLSA